MGILTKLINKWKAMTTLKKINLVLDAITGVGGGLIGTSVGNIVASGAKGKLARACVKVTSAGLGVAAGETACKALVNSWGEPLANAIDTVSGRKAAQGVTVDE